MPLCHFDKLENRKQTFSICIEVSDTYHIFCFGVNYHNVEASTTII